MAKNPTVHRDDCGTIRGYDRHYRKRETPCQPCKVANRGKAALLKPYSRNFTCEKCGEVFTIHSSEFSNGQIQKRRYCSSECRTLAKYLNRPAICERELCKKPYIKNHSKTKWCSSSCSSAHHQEVTHRRQVNKRREEKYNMSPGQYERMVEFQEGRCAICRQPQTVKRAGKVIRFNIDHCHKTGKNRSLLCTRCNLLLGGLEDDFGLIDNFIEYLEYHGFRTQGPVLGYLIGVPVLYNPDALT